MINPLLLTWQNAGTLSALTQQEVVSDVSVKVDEGYIAVIVLTLVKTAEAGTIVSSPLCTWMANVIGKPMVHGYYWLPHHSRTKLLSRSHPVPYHVLGMAQAYLLPVLFLLESAMTVHTFTSNQAYFLLYHCIIETHKTSDRTDNWDPQIPNDRRPVTIDGERAKRWTTSPPALQDVSTASLSIPGIWLVTSLTPSHALNTLPSWNQPMRPIRWPSAESSLPNLTALLWLPRTQQVEREK